MTRNDAHTANLPRLEDRVTFLTHRVNERLQHVSNPVIARFGLDLYSSRVLFALDQNGPMRVGQLVDLMALPQSTISHQLKRMEKSGLVHRTRSEVDNRTVFISVTPQGAKATQMCTDLSNLVQERIAEEFSDKELEALTEGLKRVFEILEEVPSLEKLAEEHAEHAAE
jgi:MarR family transcriptional regulator, organic hydroperoxide resistance regulator